MPRYYANKRMGIKQTSPMGFWRMYTPIRWLPYFLGDPIRIRVELEERNGLLPTRGVTHIEPAIEPLADNPFIIEDDEIVLKKKKGKSIKTVSKILSLRGGIDFKWVEGNYECSIKDLMSGDTRLGDAKIASFPIKEKTICIVRMVMGILIAIGTVIGIAVGIEQLSNWLSH